METICPSPSAADTALLIFPSQFASLDELDAVCVTAAADALDSWLLATLERDNEIDEVDGGELPTCARFIGTDGVGVEKDRFEVAVSPVQAHPSEHQ